MLRSRAECGKRFGYPMMPVPMTRSRSALPARPNAANLSPAQIRAAIPMLQARISELEAFAATSVASSKDPSVLSLQHAIEATLARIFGPGTHEYNRLHAAKNLCSVTYGEALQIGSHRGAPQIHEIQRAIERGRQRAIALLGREVELMKEQLADSGGSPADRAIRAYTNLDLHPEIARAATELYEDGHYANAIEDAVKALNGLVRLRSGETLDGAALMQKVFSPNAPILRFNALADQSDKDEQLGFMMMFSGAVAGLRNPRAHKLINDDPERALEFIAFVSLLAKLLDGAAKRP
jgi:uncharacterized protein (TIGR02391 family)